MLWTLTGAAVAAAGVLLLVPSQSSGPASQASLASPAPGTMDQPAPGAVESLWIGPETARIGLSLQAGPPMELGQRPETLVTPTPGAVVLLGMGVAMAFRRPRGHALPPRAAGSPGRREGVGGAALA